MLEFPEYNPRNQLAICVYLLFVIIALASWRTEKDKAEDLPTPPAKYIEPRDRAITPEEIVNRNRGINPRPNQ